VFRNFILKLLGYDPAKMVIVRLEPAVFADLRKKVGANCIVTQLTTDHQAGFQLGINHVLNVLQEGYVTSRP
jgi:hypothetical protein